MPAAPKIPPLVIAATLLAPLLALTLCWLGLEGLPHVSDELAYTLQSRVFAAGARVGPPADVPSMSTLTFWVNKPVSYAIFPPGWPALLSLGEGLGVPWLVNPTLFACLPLLTWGLFREAVEDTTAQLAALIAALSPGAVLLAASRMSHTSVLVALALLALIVARARDKPWAWALAGLSAGYVVTARPFDAVLVAGPLLLAGLLRTGPKEPLKALALLLGPALAAALILWDNQSLTGSAFTFPSTPYMDQGAFEQGLSAGCDRLGFGPEVGCTPGTAGYGPDQALTQGWASLRRLDLLLLGLPGFGLLAPVGAAMLGRRSIPLLALGALVIGGYALYWSPGAVYGARFYHPLYLALPLLVAVPLARVLRQWAPLLVVPLALFGSWRVLAGLQAEPYFCVDGALERQLEGAGIDQGVLFVRVSGTRRVDWPALRTPTTTCGPSLESGDAFQLFDPMNSQGGLQIRHALPDDEQTRAYLEALQPPGTPIYGAQHLPEGGWSLFTFDGSDWTPLAP